VSGYWTAEGAVAAPEAAPRAELTSSLIEYMACEHGSRVPGYGAYALDFQQVNDL